MSMKTIYTCDICRGPAERKEHVMGVCFSSLKKFTLREAESTQAIHICLGCLDQLRAQLGPKQSVEQQSQKL